MTGAGRGDEQHEGLPPFSFTPDRVQARRRASRRRRARRRIGCASSLVVAALVAAIVLVAGGFSSGHAHKRARAARPEAHAFGLALAQSSARARADEASSEAVDRVLAYTPYVSAGTPRRRDVALTFDDGPGPYTPRILQVLRHTHTPATFFVIGEW